MRDIKMSFLSIGLLAPAILLAGCNTDPATNGSKETEPAKSNSVAVSEQGSALVTANNGMSDAGQATSSNTTDHNDLYEFDYSYPAAAAALPGLATWLDNDRAKSLASLKDGATDYRAEAKKDGFPYHAYSNDTTWKIVTDLPDYISLSSETYIYTGGAHGNTAFGGLIWDKRGNEPIQSENMFTGDAAIDIAMQSAFCDKLDAARTKRRGVPVSRDSGLFNECIMPSKQTIILGSSNGDAFNRVGILVGPYAAGSYAEGTYDITLPVTPQILKAVKPQYTGAFSLK